LKIEEAYSVKKVTEIIKRSLETPTLSHIFVIGEISSLSFSKVGHIYFSLKDEDGTLLNCAFFAGYNRSLNFKPENGMKVVAYGSITVYGPRGSYNLNTFKLVPAGEGALALKLKQLKEKLQKEGLFNAERKKYFPKLPSKIGLITSQTGAAIKDFLKMTKEVPSISVVLFPAVVQGENAPKSVIKGINYFNSRGDIDCIVITRGGGSEEDLFCFNDEQLAREIAASKLPVMSAIGHEKDVLISDLVADLRQPTPTAAGRFFAENYKNALLKLEKIKHFFNTISRNYVEKHSATIKLNSLKENLINKIERLLPEKEQSVDYLYEKLFSSITRNIEQKEYLLENLNRSLHPNTLKQNLIRREEVLNQYKLRLKEGVETLIKKKSNNFENLNKRLEPNVLFNLLKRKTDTLKSLKSDLSGKMENIIVKKEEKLKYTSGTLHSVSPLAVLNRGYSVVYDKNKKSVKKSVTQINQGDNLNIQFADGFALCNVLYKEKTNGK